MKFNINEKDFKFMNVKDGEKEYKEEFTQQMKKVEEFNYNNPFEEIVSEFTMWGKERLIFLKNEKNEIFEDMLNSGTLGKHLADTMRECEDMEEKISNLLAKEWFGCTMLTINVPDFMESVQRRRQIETAVREIIRNEFIYV